MGMAFKSNQQEVGYYSDVQVAIAPEGRVTIIACRVHSQMGKIDSYFPLRQYSICYTFQYYGRHPVEMQLLVFHFIALLHSALDSKVLQLREYNKEHGQQPTMLLELTDQQIHKRPVISSIGIFICLFTVSSRDVVSPPQGNSILTFTCNVVSRKQRLILLGIFFSCQGCDAHLNMNSHIGFENFLAICISSFQNFLFILHLLDQLFLMLWCLIWCHMYSRY